MWESLVLYDEQRFPTLSFFQFLSFSYGCVLLRIVLAVSYVLHLLTDWVSMV
jgi:hypothetical protein